MKRITAIIILLTAALLCSAANAGAGATDDGIRADKLSNFVLYDPSDCTLICLFGNIPMSAVASVIDA